MFSPVRCSPATGGQEPTFLLGASFDQFATSYDPICDPHRSILLLWLERSSPEKTENTKDPAGFVFLEKMIPQSGAYCELSPNYFVLADPVHVLSGKF